MDAAELLGKVLQNKELSSAIGKKVLEGVLSGGGGGGEQTQSRGSSSGGGILGDILSGAIGGRGGDQSQSQENRSRQPSQDTGRNPLIDAVLNEVRKGRGGSPAPSSRPPQSSGGRSDYDLANIFGQSAPQPEPSQRPAASQLSPSDVATWLIRAMINAAKSDGRLDQDEQQQIVSKFGNIGQEEKEFLQREVAAPLDVARFIKGIPSGLERQVYAISVTAIELDEQKEANYLGELAQGLGLDPRWCNQVHDELGAPQIFK